MNASDSIDVRERQRFQMLQGIYDAANGRLAHLVSISAVASRYSIAKHDAMDAVQYLAAKKLISFVYPGGAHILVNGVEEYEAAHRAPSQDTKNFSATTINHFHAQVGAVQSGERSTANVQQAGPTGVAVAIVVHDLRTALHEEPAPVRGSVAEYIDAIDVLLLQRPLRQLPLRLIVEEILGLLTTERARIACANLLKFVVDHPSDL